MQHRRVSLKAFTILNARISKVLTMELRCKTQAVCVCLCLCHRVRITSAEQVPERLHENHAPGHVDFFLSAKITVTEACFQLCIFGRSNRLSQNYILVVINCFALPQFKDSNSSDLSKYLSKPQESCPNHLEPYLRSAFNVIWVNNSLKCFRIITPQTERKQTREEISKMPNDGSVGSPGIESGCHTLIHVRKTLQHYYYLSGLSIKKPLHSKATE